MIETIDMTVQSRKTLRDVQVKFKLHHDLKKEICDSTKKELKKMIKEADQNFTIEIKLFLFSEGFNIQERSYVRYTVEEKKINNMYVPIFRKRVFNGNDFSEVEKEIDVYEISLAENSSKISTKKVNAFIKDIEESISLAWGL